MKPVKIFYIIIAIILLLIAIWGFALISDRVFAALFDLWKFFGYNVKHGIPIGADSTFIFLLFTILAIEICMMFILISKASNNGLLYRLAILANIIYFVNSILIFILIFSKLAYLYCGR